MSDTLTLVPMNAEERQALRELPATIRSFKAAIAAVVKSNKPQSHVADRRQFHSLGPAAKIAGRRRQDVQRAAERGEIAGAKKTARGRTGQWAIPHSGLVAWIDSQAVRRG